jgi:hypothetical protein
VSNIGGKRMKLWVPLERDVVEQLKTLARRERRRPQDQAALILEQVLREAPSDELKKCEQAAVAAA